MAEILALSIFILLLWILNQLSKRKIKFHYRNLTAIFLGILMGWALYSFLPKELYAELRHYIKSISNIYIRSLKFMIVPIVFISITHTLIHLDNNSNVGQKFGRIILYFVLSVTCAAGIGLFMASMFNFDTIIDVSKISTDNISQGYANRIESLSDASLGNVIYGFTQNIPTSIFDAFSKNNIIGTLIIALLIGSSIKRMKVKKAQEMSRVISAIDSAKLIVNSMTMTIIKLTPYGVLALMTMAVAEKGPSLFSDLAKFVSVSYLTMAVIIGMHLLVQFLNGVNPFKHFNNLIPALITGFSTQSSGATLPVTIDTLENRNGVDTETANIAASLGTTMGMNACGAMWPVFMIVLSVGVTNAMGGQMDLYSPSVLITMFISVVISSFGIAGLPGTASFAAITAMTIMGISAEVMGIVLTFVLSVDSLIDMGRTATNIFGVSSAATFISKIDGGMDMKIFNKENQ
ncbi:cation:dicarboxylase symporter family transporter [Flammeovirga sp. MY04]|uniref:cation:dicarboxylate symporter family transporter n=1 Tax=Flammeovirga sp. MY04 TaxID=1191459 RepID=UPI0008257AC2|nr:cation:dicarboxylase symporter family transporter [Flammeovirga sp. MY04]ANQ52068.2 cation:dicarboxylase symporter family transporter [Flammeovirga sp. MY04]